MPFTLKKLKKKRKMLASLQIRKAKAFCLSYTHTMLGQKETEMNAIGPMTAATKESVLLIEAMYEDAHKGLVDEHWRVCVKPAMATDAGMATAPGMTTDIAMVTDAGMTTDEAVVLMAGAAHFYAIQEIKFGHDDMLGGSAFGLQVYEMARDELKPKYKDAFDVAAIVEVLARINADDTTLTWL